MQRERDFQRTVIDLARRTGWRVHHTRPALTQRGRWLTPVQGDVGFPDLVLCRPPRLIVAELKRVGGRLTAAQRGWLDALGQRAGSGVLSVASRGLGCDSRYTRNAHK
jgi:hypothetical protein